MSQEATDTLRADEALGPLGERHGPLRLDPSGDLYRRLVVSILRQQVSMASAEATRERLFDAVEVTPEGMLAANEGTLTGITGVGEWTARMQLLFTFGRPDVFPVGDLGVRKGMWALFDESLSRAEMVEKAQRWEPYRSYASLYLWRVEEDIAASVDEVTEG
jgi:DNA-3-methyladenine glycosylase II